MDERTVGRAMRRFWCVAIAAEAGDTPKHLYVRFGFRPVAVARSYELTADRGTT